MRVGSTIGTRKLVKAYPGLEGASLGSVVKMSSKLLIQGKLFKQLQQQRVLDKRFQASLATIKFGKKGAIVQVGANDGQHSDPLRHLLATTKVRAILVEPMPIAFEALSSLYRRKPTIQLVNSAISSKGGALTLYTPKMHGRELQSTLWTCTSREQALREVQRIMGNEALKETTISEHKIKSLTAAKLCKKCGLTAADVKVLVVDTEGQDADIVQSFLDAGSLPDLIFYERLHVPPAKADELNERLKERGYQLIQSNKDVHASLIAA